ncbi:MAG: hypothetical protein R2697_00315 [Ilumatobacteraceae bacterium]
MTVVVLLAMGSLSLRQLRLYELGRSPANLVASLSLALVSMTALIPIVQTPYNAASGGCTWPAAWASSGPASAWSCPAG